MHCQETSERMSLALDCMLTPSEAKEMEEHLETCGPCRERHQALHAVQVLLEQPYLVEPPADMSSRVMYRIRTRKRRQRVLLAWVRGAMWVVISAAMAGLVMVAVSTAREMLVPNQLMYASMWRSFLTLCQLGASIARGMQVILAAFSGGVNGSLMVLYAVLTVLVTIAWMRLVARGLVSPARAEGN